MTSRARKSNGCPVTYEKHKVAQRNGMSDEPESNQQARDAL